MRCASERAIVVDLLVFATRPSLSKVLFVRLFFQMSNAGAIPAGVPGFEPDSYRSAEHHHQGELMDIHAYPLL